MRYVVICSLKKKTRKMFINIFLFMSELEFINIEISVHYYHY